MVKASRKNSDAVMDSEAIVLVKERRAIRLVHNLDTVARFKMPSSTSYKKDVILEPKLARPETKNGEQAERVDLGAFSRERDGFAHLFISMVLTETRPWMSHLIKDN